MKGDESSAVISHSTAMDLFVFAVLAGGLLVYVPTPVTQLQPSDPRYAAALLCAAIMVISAYFINWGGLFDE